MSKKKFINLELILSAKKDPRDKLMLLELFYEDACKWAYKYIKKILYTDFIVPTKGEVASLVYQAFEKTLRNINLSKVNHLSFKNYFYLMIKYQSYAELKKTLNCGVIQNYQKEKIKLIQEQKGNQELERKQMEQLDAIWKIEKIIEFLRTKKEEYAVILEMKAKGYKSSEISKKLGISDMSLKAKLQYIRKLIREQFSNPDEIS